MVNVDPTALVLCTVFPFLSIVAVIARFRARAIQRVRLGADDWVIIPALLVALGNNASILYGAIKADLGQHMPIGPDGFAISSPNLVTFQKMIYVIPILGSVSLGCSRWSVLLLYNRIFGNHSRFRYFVYGLTAINLAWTISYMFMFIFQCWPVELVWSSQEGQERQCIALEANYGYAVSSVILDVMVLSMPWPMIWRMNLDIKQKIAASAIFLLGGIVTAAGIGKTVAFYTVGAVIVKDHDITYHEAPLVYWSVPELNLAVVCACLPILRPIIHGLTPRSMYSSMRDLVSFKSLWTASSTAISKRTNSNSNGNSATNMSETGQDGDFLGRTHSGTNSKKGATDTTTYSVTISRLSNEGGGNHNRDRELQASYV